MSNEKKEKEKRSCSFCNGRGTRQQSRVVPDHTMGVVMGAALGMGYFPSTKVEYYDERCSYCNGTGKV